MKKTTKKEKKLRWNSRMCGNCHFGSARNGKLFCSIRFENTDAGVTTIEVAETQTCIKFIRK
jgi:hypothetical protein